MLNDTSVASAGSYIRTCRRIRNSKKIATIPDFHQNICVNPTITFSSINMSSFTGSYNNDSFTVLQRKWNLFIDFILILAFFLLCYRSKMGNMSGSLKFPWCLKGYCTSYSKLACFVLYLKLINTLFKNICIL